MPAPAVIPAPIAYIIEVAVETFVVELCVLKYYIDYVVIVFAVHLVQRGSYVSYVSFIAFYFE